jgi:DNA-directed RNA polymerase I, II, and III subunit RPABC2
LTEEGKVTKSKGKQKKDKGKSKDSSGESVELKDVNEMVMEEKQKISRDEGDVEFIGFSNTTQVSGEEKVNVSSSSSGATQSVLSTHSVDQSTDEFRITLVEVKSEPGEVLIGPKRITRFERARIVGARALQLSLGASPLITVPKDSTDPISIAEYELKQKALPISIRRILPDGHYQDIPIIWLLVN